MRDKDRNRNSDRMEELISIVVPVYNVEKYLGKCLDSILGQTYQNLEVIVVDDGSTDHTGSICDEYGRKDPRVVVIHQDNQGVSAAKKDPRAVCGICRRGRLDRGRDVSGSVSGHEEPQCRGSDLSEVYI